MSVSHRYRNFGKKSAPAQPSAAEGDRLEEQKLQAFEAGYQAGWDDATKAQADEKARLSAEFSQNLQDISFSYHEAIAKLSASFEPILKEIVEKVLPSMARETLGMHVTEQINALMAESIARPIEVVVAPESEVRIQAFVEGKLAEPFKIVTDATLTDEQVFIRIGSEERKIDLNAIVDGISLATKAFFHEIEEQKNDG
jgi:flagellar assembly protein FliH